MYFIGQSTSCERLSNRGKEFVLGFGPQHPQKAYDGSIRLYVSSYHNATVRVEAPFLGMNRTYSVQEGEVKVISLSAETRMSAMGKQKKGIRLTSNHRFSVYGLQMLNSTSEGFLGLPVSLLGKRYVIASYSPSFSSFIQVVAKEQTRVQFRLRIPDGGDIKYNGKTYKDGQLLNVSLAALDSFLLLGKWYELTGTVITSDKPIAVFSGNDCTFVPENVEPCNHLVEQMPPYFSLGRTYFTRRTAGDIFRVIAADNKTAVYVDKKLERRDLQEGHHFDIPQCSTQFSAINTSKPSLLVHYSKGKSDINSKSKPFMTIVPSENQWSNDYMLEVPKDLNNHDFNGALNITIKTNRRGGFRVKSLTLTGNFNWSVIPNTEYSTTSLKLNGRSHHVYHSSPLVNFSAIFYGELGGKSFGFPAGLGALDFDECQNPKDNNCDVNANCSNVLGSCRCECQEGFVGDGITCQGTDFSKLPRTPLELCRCPVTTGKLQRYIYCLPPKPFNQNEI